MSQYKNPPLIEAVCEFRFGQSTEWGEDLIEKLYPILSENFSNREIRVLNNLHVQTTPKHASMQVQQKPLEVFWNKEKTMLVQVGFQYLSIHALNPYPSWRKFFPIIQDVYSSIRKFIQVQNFERIGFVYIDKIEIPAKSMKLEDYFHFFPHIGPNLPQNISLFNISCDISFEDNRDNCRMTLGSTISEKRDHLAFLLTTDYFLINQDSINSDNAMEWVSCAHDHIKDLFEGVITDRLKAIFG